MIVCSRVTNQWWDLVDIQTKVLLAVARSSFSRITNCHSSAGISWKEFTYNNTSTWSCCNIKSIIHSSHQQKSNFLPYTGEAFVIHQKHTTRTARQNLGNRYPINSHSTHQGWIIHSQIKYLCTILAPCCLAGSVNVLGQTNVTGGKTLVPNPRKGSHFQKSNRFIATVSIYLAVPSHA